MAFPQGKVAPCAPDGPRTRGSGALGMTAGLVIMLFAGMVYAWSVMAQSIAAENPGWTSAQLSFTFTLVMAFFCVGGLVGGAALGRVGARSLALASAAAYLVGFYVAAVPHGTPILLHLGFGVLCGVATGLVYNVVISRATRWYPGKEGLVSGALLMVFGLSSFVLGKLFAYVAPPDGGGAWRIAFRFLGIVVCAAVSLGSVFLGYEGASGNEGDDGKLGSGAQGNGLACEGGFDAGQMMRERSFWLYFAFAVLASGAGLVLVAQAAGIAKTVLVGADAGSVAALVGVISIANAAGRLAMGMAYDRLGYRFCTLASAGLLALSGLLLMWAIAASSGLVLVCAFVLGGLGYGGVMPTNSALIADFYGREHYSQNFALISTNLLFASLASTVSGLLFDATGSFLSAGVCIVTLAVVAAMVAAGVRRPA